MIDDRFLYMVAFDPSSTMAGVSYVIYDTEIKKVTHVETRTLNMKRGVNKLVAKKFGELYARLTLLRSLVCEFLNEKKVNVGSIETAYINVKRPNAVIPISYSIFTITEAFYSMVDDVCLEWISASQAKNAVYVKGNEKKDGIEAGVIRSFRDDFGYSVNVEACSEHELDALAVNIARLRAIIKERG